MLELCFSQSARGGLRCAQHCGGGGRKIIGVIMGRYKRVYLLGGEVFAVHTSERMKRILSMSGVTKIMQIYEEDM